MYSILQLVIAQVNINKFYGEGKQVQKTIFYAETIGL